MERWATLHCGYYLHANLRRVGDEFDGPRPCPHTCRFVADAANGDERPRRHQSIHARYDALTAALGLEALVQALCEGD